MTLKRMESKRAGANPTRRRGAGSRAARLAWWREARFGLFIHWGLYAVLAGTWKGRRMPYIGEWIQSYFRIPNREYAKLARRFNPVRFDAATWVRIAREAGMKYMVITAKHHDGFAMFHSANDPYNIVDATPFHRDPMKDLARECRKAGLRLCFYYSQDLDWHDPDGGGTDPALSKNADCMSWGNDWDFPDHPRKVFQRFLDRKVKPQLRELLTQYGPVGLIWFDCPFSISRAQSLALKRWVRRLQPDCLVSGRIGNDVGDYGSLGDNQIPAGGLPGDWETPATLNDTWGYKRFDHHWKRTDELIALLVDLASKGVNYLLNVGPTAAGVIPAPSVNRLRAIGRWMKVNGEAIYGTRGSPFHGRFDWGWVTCKNRRLYLHFRTWPGGVFRLTGLRSRVRRAVLLARPDLKVPVLQRRDGQTGMDILELMLPPRAPDKPIAVLALELAAPVAVDPASATTG